MSLYDAAYYLAVPFMRFSKRLRPGFKMRKVPPYWGTEVSHHDIWLHAASGGEAYLAWEIVKECSRKDGIKTILATTCTDQGLEVLRRIEEWCLRNAPKLSFAPTYFPFDAPSLMHKALLQARPRLVVLLETELWPGLLATCAHDGVPLAVINGRLSTRSMARYLPFRRLFRSAAPSAILAVSEEHQRRYDALFGNHNVRGGIRIMPNIKFDRFTPGAAPPFVDSPLATVFKPGTSLCVFGSIRRDEQKEVTKAITVLREQRPKTCIALFPRHLHHVKDWARHLDAADIPWILRSTIHEPVSPGALVLWDKFGELQAAYGMARAAFVGGSLAPLGGQNFLEPLAEGVVPCIGPHWKNFSWVGKEIVEQDLVRIVKNGEELGRELVAYLQRPQQQLRVKERFQSYLEQRKGGTRIACEAIQKLLAASPR